MIVADKNTGDRLIETSIQTPINYEILDKFQHDLVDVDKLKGDLEEGPLQSSEISMNTNQKKTIPKTLVTPLLEGHEIEWAEITEATLKEFPHLSDRLKMQGLIQFMEEHPIAREEAVAQLHRQAKDPTYEALKNFFGRIKDSYDLTDRQKYKRLEHAIAQQQFNWKRSPANNVR